ncbi:unnamed protein product [Linum trigynum]|uniref:Late embryogenesis abundant protein LEA-2 subgroup domain-containing protein n=1 Tax=Linum trigynum TaxID=586398 RepID=A0AAV2F7I7_9ROSI
MDNRQGEHKDKEGYSSDFDRRKPEHPILDNSHPSSIKPPPGRRRVPRRYREEGDNVGGEGGCCVKCMCCCFCLWLLIILSLVGILVMLYSILQPRPPSFNIQYFQVNAFSLRPNSGNTTLTTEFFLTLKSQNPNKGIGFFYGRGSSVSMLYNGTTIISSGKLPTFQQTAESTNLMNVTLDGMSNLESGLQDSLEENEKGGRIPLLVMVNSPAAVVLRSFPLREIAVFVNGSLVVDSLIPGRNPKILSSQYACSVGL